MKVVKVRVDEELHEYLKKAVKKGRLRRAGVWTISDAYRLALKLLIKVIESGF